MNLFRKLEKPPASSGRPWLEFPNDTDGSPEQALLRICRILWQPQEKLQIAEIEGQGMGGRTDSYEVRFFRVFKKILHLDDPLSDAVADECRAFSATILANRSGFDLTAVGPDDAAQLMHILFVHHFKLKPYNERGHYNIAAYWV